MLFRSKRETIRLKSHKKDFKGNKVVFRNANKWDTNTIILRSAQRPNPLEYLLNKSRKFDIPKIPLYKKRNLKRRIKYSTDIPLNQIMKLKNNLSKSYEKGDTLSQNVEISSANNKQNKLINPRIKICKRKNIKIIPIISHVAPYIAPRCYSEENTIDYNKAIYIGKVTVYRNIHDHEGSYG